jgi:hypothetical protein
MGDSRFAPVDLPPRLGGDGSLLEPFPYRPMGMKRKTWWRLVAKANSMAKQAMIESVGESSRAV